MTRRLLAHTLVVMAVAFAIAPVGAQRRYIDGVFVHAGSEPIELLTFADRITAGQLRLSSGSFEDVPIVERVHRVLCSLPNWQPSTIWMSTKEIFTDEHAERRLLPFAVRRINVYALELRITDLEDPAKVKRLLASVGATEDNPGFVFITMQAGSVVRDYMVQLSADDQ